MLKKNYFHTKKIFCCSITRRVRSRLAYPEDASFLIYFLFVEIAQGAGQRAYIDLKSSNPEINNIKPK
jgi:hypothetical protein